MKIIGLILAGALLLSSASLFAESHLDSALEHANAAVKEGQAGKLPKLVIHAKAALDHSLAASVVSKSVSKTHIDQSLTRSLFRQKISAKYFCATTKLS